MDLFTAGFSLVGTLVMQGPSIKAGEPGSELGKLVCDQTERFSRT
jgi:hypothetical protein